MDAPAKAPTPVVAGNKLFWLAPAVAPEKMLENMRSAIARGLPQAEPLKPHDRILSVLGGGPSVADTYLEAQGYIATINGSLKWLLERYERDGLPENVQGLACGVCDPGAHIADQIIAHPDVRYYIASVCDPSVFDRVLSIGCDVRLWHVTPNSHGGNPQDMLDILNAAYPEVWHAIGGGCTMGLRWIDLGIFLGFRRFHLHGLDSSFRGDATHAYPDRADKKEFIELNGRLTRPNFVAQVYDFFEIMDRLALEHPDLEIKVLGDGLLQDECKPYFAAQAGFFERNRFPEGDTEGPMIIRTSRQLVNDVLFHVKQFGVAVQAGGNVGVMAKMLAEHFGSVYTFEPDPANWDCLVDNIDGVANIIARPAGLGSKRGTYDLAREAGNCGATYLAPSAGSSEAPQAPVIRLDDLNLEACDLLILDVEGYELEALKGARETIAKFKPIIAVEENRLSERYGTRRGACLDWLVDTFDYGVVGLDEPNYILAPQ